jgi:hypothetical protein
VSDPKKQDEEKVLEPEALEDVQGGAKFNLSAQKTENFEERSLDGRYKEDQRSPNS